VTAIEGAPSKAKANPSSIPVKGESGARFDDEYAKKRSSDEFFDCSVAPR